MEKKTLFTVSIYTENNVGLLNRISAIFLKRHINIESFTTSECEIKNVFRFIILVEMTHSGIGKIIKQIEKQVEDRKSTRLNSSHVVISYAVFCLKKKKNTTNKTVWKYHD